MGKTASKGRTISTMELRAFVAARQGMAGGLARKRPADVLAATGWARSVGGANPYVALHDRAGLSRVAIDRAVAALELHELPSARGCTYVVPARDFAIALRAAQGKGDDAAIATAKKHCGVTDREIDALSAKVVDAVAKEPLDPAAIRERVGDAARSLGAEGKKRGVGTTLPLALGRLQTRGEIRRVPVDGRLDQQRYRYVRWSESPLSGKRIDEAELARELATRFFRWSVSATAQELAWWAGLGVKAARATIAELELVPLEDGDERFVSREDREALLAFDPPREPRVSFVTSLDDLVHLRRSPAHWLDPEDLAKKTTGSKPLGGLADLEYHPIVDRGRIVGLWDWDGVAGELVWRTFAGAPKGTEEAAEETARFVREELGDMRSFSLDSPESRVARIDALRKARWGR